MQTGSARIGIDQPYFVYLSKLDHVLLLLPTYGTRADDQGFQNICAYCTVVKVADYFVDIVGELVYNNIEIKYKFIIE